ncbi:CapA family protein [uncultured Tissierella sp.]|uniref:CapA family protein n=1 Tax=uncultured Tissierella sp. TaxID=448160 RepID=UPI002804852F|nr:CapA family protein [uncultured Tissierella sp.]MDU5082085.1 CapA family protein [Bacillota bacterium]
MRKKHNIIIIFLILAFCFLGFMGAAAYMKFKSAETNITSEYIEADKEIDEEKSVIKNLDDITEVIEEPRISTINLLAVGDIMFHSPQYKAAFNKETLSYDFTSTFRHIKKYVEKANIALGNFETVTAGEEIPFSGFPRFNTPKESLLALKETGFDILATANNHCLDHGKTGLIRTIDNINEYGMKNIGTYKEPNNNILIEEIENIRIGFLSYTYGLNGMDSTLTGEELSYMVNRIDEEKIKRDIEKARSSDIDLIVVFIHWGNEYQREPSSYQIELGEKMVEWGANIILGSHPHVIQRSQIINRDGKDNFIIYSMGNFLSNQRKETMDNSYTEDGVMINLEIEKDFSSQETVIKNIQYIPTWVYKYRENNKLFFEILPIDDYINGELNVSIADSLKGRLKKSYDDTMSKMSEN